MTRHRIEMAGTVRDLFAHLPPDLKRKVKAALPSVTDDPFQAKELREELAGLRISDRQIRAHLPHQKRRSGSRRVRAAKRALEQRAREEAEKKDTSQSKPEDKAQYNFTAGR